MTHILSHFSHQCDLLLQTLIKPLCGSFTTEGSKIEDLSNNAQQIIHKAFTDIDARKVIDYHVHLIGSTKHKGNYLHHSYFSWMHPYMHLSALIMMSGFGITELESCEVHIIDRLLQLINQINPHGRYCLLAFDKTYEQDGAVNIKNTRFHISNEFVFKIAQEFPESFIPIMSVHPYRTDAIDELYKWADQGGRIVQWMPNVMHIMPYDERCIPFYEAMKKLSLTLLCHSGHESVFTLSHRNNYGNPLFLKYPLDVGVKVIVAHCATLGINQNIHHPKSSYCSNFELFLELALEKKYNKLLFGDISAVTQINRIFHLKRLIEEAQPGYCLSGRLINGSGYPLPALNISVSTRLLKILGYITHEERCALNEIYYFNPLLFEFTHKRVLKHPKTHRTLPKDVFMQNPLLSPCSQA